MAWHFYARSWAVFCGSVLVLFGSWVLLELIVVATQRFGVLPWAAAHVVFLIVFAGLMAGLHVQAMDALDGRDVRLATLFSALDRGPALLLASVAYLTLVVLGLALLVVPGVYVAVRYALLGQVAAEQRRSPLDMLRTAGAATRGRWSSAAWILAQVMLLNIVGACVVGVGLLVTLPVSVLVATSSYRSAEGET